MYEKYSKVNCIFECGVSSIWTTFSVTEALEVTTIEQKNMKMKGYVYILECMDGSYYTGSTKDIVKRLHQHKIGHGSNHTKKRLPIRLVYLEEFVRIDEAFYREKQIQGWSRRKKEALITGNFNQLPELSKAYRDLE